jgi:hypothetical protein
MVKNRTYLLDGNPGEPFHKLSDLDPIFKVLKKS